MLLSEPIDTDNPENLYKQIATIEAYLYLVIKYQSEAEHAIAEEESNLRVAGKSLQDYSGTQAEKKAQFDAEYNDIYKRLDARKAEFHLWSNLGKVIEKKINLAQTILSSIKASMQAGIRI